MAKYVFVTGGVVSGLGKGITAASIALLLKSRGYKVFMQKFDPYINVDPGTMSPYQHGEVFVTADGAETDLDLGHYERFIDEELNYTSSVSMGKIYSSVLEKERRGDYLGGTVQIVPHVTNEIKSSIFASDESSHADIIITEIGGTVGDIEGSAILESLRQIRNEIGVENTVFVHTTLVPSLYGSHELKTKPTQQSVIELRRIGIQPDIIVTRSEKALSPELKSKLSLFTSIPKENVIDAIDLKNVYRIPLNFKIQKIDEIVLKRLGMNLKRSNTSDLEKIVNKVENLKDTVTIGLVGKYTSLKDAYLSVSEALKHAGYHKNVCVEIKWIDSEELEKSGIETLKTVEGIIIPGGFGIRGTDGKKLAIKYARENNIPLLGICFGMQLAAIEFAESVCGLNDCNSYELNSNCENPIIDIMEEQKNIAALGGTMRLGNYDCKIEKGTLAYSLYKKLNIQERHRHRYEFNSDYKSKLEEKGMVFSGYNPKTGLVEIIEIPEHKYFIACQFHPEFKSRPTKPHPLFVGLIKNSKIKS